MSIAIDQPVMVRPLKPKKKFQSSLPIRVMANDDVPFSGFSFFAWVINEVESEGTA